MNSKQNDNPVAHLRKKFFEKKKNRIPSQEIRDTFKKKEPLGQQQETPRKIARPYSPRIRKDIDL